jgi:hypothetical protein
MGADNAMAEREGFEPSIPLRVCRISSAVLSTTQPPLRIARGAEEGWLVARHSAAIKGCHPPIPAGEGPGRIIRRRQAAGRHLDAWDTDFRLQAQNYVPAHAYVRHRRDDRGLSFSISWVSM